MTIIVVVSKYCFNFDSFNQFTTTIKNKHENFGKVCSNVIYLLPNWPKRFSLTASHFVATAPMLLKIQYGIYNFGNNYIL